MGCVWQSLAYESYCRTVWAFEGGKIEKNMWGWKEKKRGGKLEIVNVLHYKWLVGVIEKLRENKEFCIKFLLNMCIELFF